MPEESTEVNPQTQTVKIGPFPRGINNIESLYHLPEGSLRSALNVDIDDVGTLRPRKGFTQIHSGVGIHSLYERHFVEGTDLKYIEDDDSITTVVSGLSGKKLSYCKVSGQTLFSDQIDIKYLSGDSIGVEEPHTLPTLSELNGSMPAGDYMIAFTFVDPATMQMSPASKISKISMDNGGILITNIPQPVGDQNINIYVSKPSGSELYFYASVPKGTVSFSVTVTKSNTHVIPTLNTQNIPAGHIIRAFKGRLFSAVDNIVYYSQPPGISLTKISEAFYMFPSKIVIMQPVHDGMYIIADKTYFLKGNNPDDFSLEVVSDLTAIEGTGLTIDASKFNFEDNNIRGEIAYWFNKDGGVIGQVGGSIIEFSKDKLAVPKNLQNGSATYVEENGLHKIITNFATQNRDDLNVIGASDKAEVKIIRNGVIV